MINCFIKHWKEKVMDKIIEIKLDKYKELIKQLNDNSQNWYEEYKRMLFINESLSEHSHYLDKSIFDCKQKINDQELIISKLRNQLESIFNTCKSNINNLMIEEEKG